MDPHVSLGILEYSGEAFHKATISAIREIPLRIVARGRHLVTLQCTGTHPRHLAAGYLFGCGLIEGAADIAAMDVQEDEAGIEVRVELARSPAEALGVSLSSGMGRELLPPAEAGASPARPLPPRLPPPSGPTVRPEAILSLVRELLDRSSLYRLTRGCHNAALCVQDSILVFRSDLGRHNAVDTLVGQCLLENIPTGDKMIVSTGRITSELVHKAVRAGIGIYVSISVSTGQAARIARASGLTLVGNVSADTFWVYNDTGRLFPRP